MEDLFFECESAYTGSMQHITLSLESAIFTYSEDLLTNHYVSESVSDSLWTRLKDFFTKIILAIKNFIKELKVKIEYAINEKQIKQKLHALHEELKDKEYKGINAVELTDYISMKNIFNQYYDKLIGYAKKFSKVKYTKTYQIENDLEEFDKMMDKFNKELEEASNKKVKWSVKKALDFVEDELRGKSDVFKTLNQSMSDFAEIEQIAENLRTKMNVLGVDVIPKHVGFIQKMIIGISGFIRKWTIKIIMGIVFIFTF